ncbi:MAG: hypothetical protein IKS87_02775, partial [Lachnospiraceae bacterium]|nr:hypothetical protein [Lachnospiraceae bacterium]
MALNTDCRVSISEDHMKATLFLTPPPAGESYTVQDVTDHLRHNGVNNGLIFSAIEEMVNNREF